MMQFKYLLGDFAATVKFKALAAAMLIIIGLCIGNPAMAQGKPLRIIVPFASGGGQDILTRAFSNELGAALGQPVIIDYRPGGGGGVGTSYVAKSEPDGTTLIMAAASHIISAVLSPRPSYHPIKDFAAVAHVGTGSQVLIINSELPARSVQEFVRHAKANPGKFNYGTAGSGSSTHLAMAYFLNAAGIDLAHIPYKSNAAQSQELIAGRIQAIMIPSISAVALARDSRVRLLAVSPDTRSSFFPDLPTVAESGYPGFNYLSWFGLLAPAGMARSQIERINTEVTRLLANPAIIDRMTKIGIEPQALSVPQFEKVLREDLERVERIVKLSGAKSE